MSKFLQAADNDDAKAKAIRLVFSENSQAKKCSSCRPGSKTFIHSFWGLFLQSLQICVITRFIT